MFRYHKKYVSYIKFITNIYSLKIVLGGTSLVSNEEPVPRHLTTIQYRNYVFELYEIILLVPYTYNT